MNNSVKFFMRTCAFACVLFAVFSCKDDDEFLNKSDDNPVTEVREANTFDFSTTQEVDLIVDYSAFNANVPVFFSVYSVNPFVNENKVDEYIDENIRPIYAAYTDKYGKFDQTVNLPAYARVLHIVTGNFLVGLRRTMVEIVDGQARAIVENPGTSAFSRLTRAAGPGTSTTDMTQMPHLYKTNGGTQVYKPWLTPLGTWNSASGRPDYLLPKDDPVLISKGLVFTEQEFNGLYATACDALNSGTNMKETYRQASDLTLIKESEVSITALGSSTCWNSSMGYYYYTGDAPTNKMDLNIIMIFPNTQDGQWPRGSYPNNKYNGNIGTLRGDVVQLMYYPPTADGGLDLSKGTTMFPAGTKIGFILRTNAWGQRGADYAVNGSSYAKKMNIWASTTDGLSYAPDGGKCPNPDGEARSAKFAYTSANGNKYVAVSFEDACDDKDYDDLIFALNPANAFDFGDFSTIESHKFTSYGIYSFEDRWPNKCDYDMNDAVIELKHEIEYYSHGGDASQTKYSTETYYFTTYQNFVTEKNGLGVKLNLNIKTDSIATIYLKKYLKGQSEPVVATYKNENNKYYYLPEFTKEANNVYLFTDNITNDLGASYAIEITYKTAQSQSWTNVKPFIYRKGSDYDFRWEVHVPYEAPIDASNKTLFGTGEDRSTGKSNYYTCEGLYPFAFYLDGVTIDQFKNTILKPENESKPIDTFFPQFIEWSKSKGSKNLDWYLHPESN